MIFTGWHPELTYLSTVPEPKALKSADFAPPPFLKDFLYLFMRDTEGEAETQAKGEAGSMQGA